MKKILFASDMDNTIIFSEKHKINNDICVEYLNEKEQSFITCRTKEVLEKINKNMIFIPVTTRSVEQYKRINFSKNCVPKYAVTTNGAILLEDGKINQEWLNKSKEIVKPWIYKIEKMFSDVSNSTINKRCKIVDDMYLYAAYDNVEDATKDYNNFCNKTELDVCISGRKVYFFPKDINKGIAITRLCEMFDVKKIISAGDSIIDIPMILQSDIGIIPSDLDFEKSFLNDIRKCPSDIRFYDYVLDNVEKYC